MYCSKSHLWIHDFVIPFKKNVRSFYLQCTLIFCLYHCPVLELHMAIHIWRQRTCLQRQHTNCISALFFFLPFSSKRKHFVVLKAEDCMTEQSPKVAESSPLANCAILKENLWASGGDFETKPPASKQSNLLVILAQHNGSKAELTKRDHWKSFWVVYSEEIGLQ